MHTHNPNLFLNAYNESLDKPSWTAVQDFYMMPDAKWCQSNSLEAP